jgi:hypothetical protein
MTPIIGIFYSDSKFISNIELRIEIKFLSCLVWFIIVIITNNNNLKTKSTEIKVNNLI